MLGLHVLLAYFSLIINSYLLKINQCEILSMIGESHLHAWTIMLLHLDVYTWVASDFIMLIPTCWLHYVRRYVLKYIMYKVGRETRTNLSYASNRHYERQYSHCIF